MSMFRIVSIAAALALATVSVSTSLGSAARANASLRIPDGYHMSMLVHSTVAALDQANRTGNYHVLRSLAAPAFQQANDQARLSQIFARLRQSQVRLTPAILYDPMLSRPARIDEVGHLRLTGFFPTAPLRIHFDLRFVFLDGEWRLFGISIQPRSERRAQTG